MFKKINLNISESYGVQIAVNKIAEMLAGFIDGRTHHHEIGSEQGGIGRWDDLILRNSSNWIHIQIKRQTTDFDNGDTERALVKRGKDKDSEKLRDLTEFDKTIVELAEWIKKTDQSQIHPPKKFIIELPDGGVQIKKDFYVRDLMKLCNIHIKETTTASQMEEMQDEVNFVKLAFTYFNTWCGLNDWDEILKVLKPLTIQVDGYEDRLIESTKQLLSPFYKEIETVIAKINQLVLHGAPAPNSLTARYIYTNLYEFLKPEKPRWTQYSKNSLSRWVKSGIQDINDIEHPKITVNNFWNERTSFSLMFNNNEHNDFCKLSTALIRLGIHFKSNCTFNVIDPKVWEQITFAKTGGTLGMDETDLENLVFVDYTPFEASDNFELKDEVLEEKEAESLNEEMLIATRTIVYKKVNLKIRELNTGDLKNIVNARWAAWMEDFDKNPAELECLFLQMMKPIAEGEDIIAILRIGPKTAHLIAHGILLLLIVSVGFDKINHDWISTKNQNLIVKALRYWSGPPQAKRKITSISSSDMKYIIDKENCNCLLLSGSNTPISGLYGTSLAGSFDDPPMLTEKKKTIITDSNKLSTIINGGSIKELEEFIQTHLKNINASELINTLQI
ncbi:MULTISPECIES: ABC-three component system protein [Sphingobacterium]|uniref:ABC-three component system protein n=1 Tax=Sphingobacterium TaxID=28453 RepID=UPI002579DDF8|nr:MULTISPECIES: ABC-three component system protein [Sphingobacterium]